MKKVIISSNVCWSLYNFRRNLITSLLNKGFEVTIVSKKDGYTARLIDLGCKFESLKIEPSGMNPFYDLLTFYDLVRIYRKIKPDYVLNFSPKNNIYGTLAARFFKFKVINNIAGLGVAFISNNMLSKVVKFLYKVSQSRANVIFFQNTDDKKVFINNKLCDGTVASLLPGSGVDLNRFSPDFKPIGDKIVFILVARMLFDKGIKYYVDAARILSQDRNIKVEFRLLGFIENDNPSSVSKLQMKEWVDEGVVNYLGVSDAVEFEVNEADCVVLPSFYREGVPRSLLEAGALGKPIITTDSVGCREAVINKKTGFICEPKNLNSLVESLYNFIHLPNEAKLQMGRNSYLFIHDNFDEKIVINKYLDYLV